MLNVVEAFSGIGAQSKALRRIGAEHQILNTVEWDVHAIYAYDIIHNGPQNIEDYLQEMDKPALLERLAQYQLSLNGKTSASSSSFRSMREDALRRILFAIERTHNLVNITNVHSADLPLEIDLLTYSFPCQDLSVCGSWHGNMNGIDRDANTRSGLLWQIERIIGEMHEANLVLPKFLLMENVSNILSARHSPSFEEWKNYLEELGYFNQVYTLNAQNFGIPQHRNRAFMLSVYCENPEVRLVVAEYFRENNLEQNPPRQMVALAELLKLDYQNQAYRFEADESNPNYTPSRRQIREQNIILHDGHRTITEIAWALTTKQDRNPNSGLILYDLNPQRAPYRNLTPRECFLLMGFDEDDFQALSDNDFVVRNGRRFFAREIYTKMTGNSIVVNVLEAIFQQVVELKAIIWPEGDNQ